MKILNPRAHAYIDYLVVLHLLAAPNLFGFTDAAALIFYTLAAAYLVLTLSTAYPLGIFKVIPFPLHGAIELLIGVALVGLPLLLDFARTEALARNVYVATGAMVFITWLVTDYKVTEVTREAIV